MDKRDRTIQVQSEPSNSGTKHFFSNTFNPTGRTTVSQQHEGGKLDYNSHDLRLSYDPGGAFKGDIGYFHSETDDRFVFGTRASAPGKTLLRTTTDPLDMTGRVVFTNNHSTYDVDAIFARGSYVFLGDRATISAEGRYSRTDIVYDDILARTTVPSRPILTDSFKEFTPRITGEYRLTPHNLLYVSVAKGVKTGGFNGYVSSTTVLTTDEQSFEPESNWTYEIGSKNTFFDNTLIMNAAVFYVDWTNKQTRVVPTNFVPSTVVGATSPSIYRSIGDATSLGVELSGVYRPIKPLQLTYAANYTKAEYAEGAIAPDYIGLCNGVNCPTNGAVGGNQIEGSPKFSATLGAEYRDTLSGDWDYFVGADVTYQGKQFQDSMNLVGIDSYALVDSRIGVDNGTWRAFVWAKNLFDKEYIQGAFGTLSLRQYTPSFGERRTVGVTVSASF